MLLYVALYSLKMVHRFEKEGVKYVALVGLGPKPKTVQDLEVMSANRLGKLVVGLYCVIYPMKYSHTLFETIIS